MHSDQLDHLLQYPRQGLIEMQTNIFFQKDTEEWLIQEKKSN